jgi:cytochrome c peroxidase
MDRRIIIAFTVSILFFLVAWAQGIKEVDYLREVYSGPSDQWPKPTIDDGIDWKEIAALPDNPYRNVDSLKPIIELGKVLFFDPRLSASNQISCGSCHDPELGWSNGRSNAIGHDHQLGSRNAMGLANSWANTSFFWDGRAKSLEEQALMPIEDPIEMHGNLDEITEKIASIKGYAQLFETAYDSDEVTTERIAQSLAYFQRSITSRKSDFDYFLGGKTEAMTDEAILGMHLFRTKARCMNCHNGPFFTDRKFHNLGLHYYGRKYEDRGRYVITENPEDMGAFKTPSLRDVMFTGPWMHNGFFGDIEGVINMYDNGMARPKPRPGLEDDPLFPTTSPILKKLNLTEEEKQHLIAFLESISATPFRMGRPELPE